MHQTAHGERCRTIVFGVVVRVGEVGMRIVRMRRESGTRIVRLMLVTLAAVASGAPSLMAHPVAAAPASLSSVSSTVVAESAASVTFHVYATREGLVGGTTSSGHTITPSDHFVALPSVKALNKSVKISYKGKSATCLLYTSPSPRDRQKSRMPSSA